MNDRSCSSFITHRSNCAWSGPVSRILFPSRFACAQRSGRESFICRSHCCGGQATYPDTRTETGGSIASLFGLAPQGVCRAVDTHVRRGALLPHRFTLTSLRLACARRSGSAVCFLLHFPSRHRAWPLASLLPVGVRTFLEDELRDSPAPSTHESITALADMKILEGKLLLFK